MACVDADASPNEDLIHLPPPSYARDPRTVNTSPGVVRRNLASTRPNRRFFPHIHDNGVRAAIPPEKDRSVTTPAIGRAHALASATVVREGLHRKFRGAVHVPRPSGPAAPIETPDWRGYGPKQPGIVHPLPGKGTPSITRPRGHVPWVKRPSRWRPNPPGLLGSQVAQCSRGTADLKSVRVGNTERGRRRPGRNRPC